MVELIHSAQSFMNAKYTIIANKKKKAEQEKKRPRRQDRPWDDIPTTLY